MTMRGWLSGGGAVLVGAMAVADLGCGSDDGPDPVVGNGGSAKGGSSGASGQGGGSGTGGTSVGGSSGEGGTSSGGSSGTGGQSGQAGSSGMGGQDAGVGGSAGDACVPKTPTCPTATYCGIFDTTDGCGNAVAVDCGGCQDGFSCENHACTCAPVFPACNGQCGTISGPDGCGGTATKNCGGCGKGTQCSGNQCTDIDECITGNSCSPYADCTNTWGSYTCTCWPGYTGSGYTCKYEHPFACGTPTRDAEFDALKPGGQDVLQVGGIWGTSGTNYYVPVHNATGGYIARYTGSWSVESLTPTPHEVYGVWGSSSNDVWVAGRTNAGTLFHWDGTAWTQDINTPNNQAIRGIWGSDANTVYVVGEDLGGTARVWKRAANTWVAESIPAIPKAGFVRIWGVGNEVFVAGHSDDNANGVPDHCHLLHYNGYSWNDLAAPSACLELVAVHGSSNKDIYVTGRTIAGAVVYRLTYDLQSWQEFVEPTIGVYGPIFSKYPGTFLAAGNYGTLAASGVMRLTTDDEVSDPVTAPVDSEAYDAAQFWQVPGTNKMHVVTSSPLAGNAAAGHYSFECN